MKKFSVFTVFASVLFLASISLLFTSCEQEDAIGVSAPITTRSTPPEVPSILEIGEGFEVSFHTYAEGVQVYVSTETAPGVYNWVFKEPIATLYSNPGFTGVVGTHYAGPTWESNSGSTVVAARLEGVTVDPTAIPWLKLGTVTESGPGIFDNTTHIQRVNTVGGKAPATGANASNVGDEIQIPYTAEYFFYKAE
ncbi:MAG TPA: DUF3455 domain-containing protein [Saprospiraceae bacterium]